MSPELERAVGPLPLSIVAGDNATLIASVAPLYLTGSVLDVTYGRGLWWRRFTPSPFEYHDLALDGVDFRELPHGERSWDAVCFDPPYIPHASHVAGDEDFRERYGLGEPRNRAELDDLIAAGVAECARVAARWVLVKCCDYTNGRQFHLGHVAVIRAGESAGLRVHDLLVHSSGSGIGGGRIRNVLRSRVAHSYLVVFSRSRRR
jgi:hypothetical protein